jgi:hypothetical protein
MPPTYVTLDDAKRHLHLVLTAGSDEELDLQVKLGAAEAIILDYIKATTNPPPSDAVIQAAILIELGELWGLRGDNLETQLRQAADGYLIPLLTAILHRKRDPALA